MMNLHVRWTVRRDMNRVLEIEKENFNDPWTEADFLQQLRERNKIAMVGEVGEEVVSFMIYELHEKKLILLNFAVAKDWQRLGVGRKMLEKLQSKLSSHRRNRITLEVSERDLGAHLFLKKVGFQAIRVLKNFYEDADAYKFVYRIKETALTECSY